LCFAIVPEWVRRSALHFAYVGGGEGGGGRGGRKGMERGREGGEKGIDEHGSIQGFSKMLLCSTGFYIIFAWSDVLQSPVTTEITR
jgi:hypothetical protein